MEAPRWVESRLVREEEQRREWLEGGIRCRQLPGHSPLERTAGKRAA